MMNVQALTNEEIIDALTDNDVMRAEILQQGGYASVDIAWFVKFQMEDSALKEEVERRGIEDLLEREPWS